MAIGWRDEVVAFVQKAKELVKTVAVRMIVSRPAKMPLANQACCVSLIVQQLGERCFLGR